MPQCPGTYPVPRNVSPYQAHSWCSSFCKKTCQTGTSAAYYDVAHRAWKCACKDRPGTGGGVPTSDCKCPKDYYVCLSRGPLRGKQCCPTRLGLPHIVCQGTTSPGSPPVPSPGGPPVPGPGTNACPPGQECMTQSECQRILGTARSSCGGANVCCSVGPRRTSNRVQGGLTFGNYGRW